MLDQLMKLADGLMWFDEYGKRAIQEDLVTN